MEFDARYGAHDLVEEFGWQGFRQWVVTDFFPTRDHVIALVENHVHKSRYFVGAVLKIGVHGDDNATLCGGKAFAESRAFAIVAAETYAEDARVLLMQLFHTLPGIIRTAVVDNDDFVGICGGLHDALNPLSELTETLLLVKRGHNDGQIDHLWCLKKDDYVGWDNELCPFYKVRKINRHTLLVKHSKKKGDVNVGEKDGVHNFGERNKKRRE